MDDALVAGLRRSFALSVAASRRKLIAVLPSGLGVVAQALLARDAAAIPKYCNPPKYKCPTCKRCKGTGHKKTCVKDIQKNGKHCLGDGKCYAGKCIPRPKCLSAGSLCEGVSIGCCSGVCARSCAVGGEGDECLEDTDCGPGMTCVSYRCRFPRIKARRARR